MYAIQKCSLIKIIIPWSLRLRLPNGIYFWLWHVTGTQINNQIYSILDDKMFSFQYTMRRKDDCHHHQATEQPFLFYIGLDLLLLMISVVLCCVYANEWAHRVFWVMDISLTFYHALSSLHFIVILSSLFLSTQLFLVFFPSQLFTYLDLHADFLAVVVVAVLLHFSSIIFSLPDRREAMTATKKTKKNCQKSIRRQ